MIPVFQDFVSDKVRSRPLTVVSFTILFVLAVFTTIAPSQTYPNVVDSISLVAPPPRSMSFAQSFVRHARVHAVNDLEKPVSGVSVKAAVTLVEISANTQIADINCDTESVAALNGTLEASRIAAICMPVLSQVESTTDDLGLAQFSEQMFLRGPPGLWTLTYSAGDVETTFQASVFSSVYDVLVMNSAPEQFTVRQPLPIQPVLQLLDIRGHVIVGRTVIAFVSSSPFDSDDANLNEGAGYQGQRYGTLANYVSEPSDSDGVVRFRQLTVLASSSPVFFIGFYCEGVISTWSKPLVEFGTSIADKFSKILPSLPLTLFGSRVNSPVCTVSIDVPPSVTVVEGRPFATQPQLRVRDASGNPVGGVYCFALLATSSGWNLPLLLLPGLQASQGVQPKLPIHAMSGPSSASGVAAFSALGVQVCMLPPVILYSRSNLWLAQSQGDAGSLKLIFACDGVFSPVSAEVTVQSSVSAVVVTQIPDELPFPTNETLSTLSGSAPFLSVRVVDAESRGLPGKKATVALVDELGAPVPANLAAVSTITNVDFPGVVNPVSNSDGFITTAVQISYLASNDTGNVPTLFLQVSVDGVLSSPFPVVVAAARSSVCAAIIGLTALPAVVTENVPVALPPLRFVNATLGAVPNTVVTLAPLHALVPGLFSHAPPQLFMVSVWNASAAALPSDTWVNARGFPQTTTDADGYATFRGVSFNGPIGSSLLYMVYSESESQNCKTDVIDVFVNSASASLQVVPPSGALLSCPSGGSGFAHLRSCACKDRPISHDLGDVEMGVLFTITLYASTVNTVVAPLAGAQVLPVLRQVPLASVRLAQFNDGSGVGTDDGTVKTIAFGALSGLPGFLTVFLPSTGTGADGKVDVQLMVTPGYPGRFSLVFGLNSGAITQTVSFNALSKVASIAVHTQPASAGGYALTGNVFTTQPAVTVLDAAGLPLQGYVVEASFVTESLDAAPAGADIVRYLGTGLSRPSDATGVAVFGELGFLDALTGCYLVQFSVTAASGTAVVRSQPVCVQNLDEMRITQQPPKEVSSGTPFTESLRVEISRPYLSDFASAGYFSYFALVSTYTLGSRAQVFQDNIILSGNSSLSSFFVSPKFISNGACLISPDGSTCPLVTSFSDGKYRAEVTFPSITWRRAAPGDHLALRVYSGLIYVNPYALDIRRGIIPPDNGTSTSPSCVGANVLAGDPLGGFAACCDSNAQCGASLVCNTARRVCTRACTSDVQCGDLLEPQTGVPSCDNGYCAADRALGWSFAPFCKTCATGNWLGALGGTFNSQSNQLNAEAIANVLTTTVDAFCGSNIVFQATCASFSSSLSNFTATVTAKCSVDFMSDSFCSTTITPQSLKTSLFVLLKLDRQTRSLPDAERTRIAVDRLFVSVPAPSFGSTAESSTVNMVDSPAIVFPVLAPPDTVRVGEQFEVPVFVGVSSGAPLPRALVTATIISVSQGGLTESVDAFVRRVSGRPPALDADWTKVSLDSDTDSELTDMNGLAWFELRITGALPGQYTLKFTCGATSSTASDPFTVSNDIATVAIVRQPELDARADKDEFSDRWFELPTIALNLTGQYGEPIVGLPSATFNFYVRRVLDLPSIGSRVADFREQWHTLSAQDKLSWIASLAMQGGRQLSLVPEPAANVEVDAGNLVEAGGGMFRVQGARLRFSKPGEYQLVFVVNNIASDWSSTITSGYTGSLTPWQKVLQYLITWGMFFLTVSVALGNSTWYASRATMVSLVVCVAGIIIVAFGFEVSSGPQANLLFALYACGIVLTLLNAWRGVAGTFTAKRDEVFFAYVQSLFNGRARRMREAEKVKFLRSLTHRSKASVSAEVTVVPVSTVLCAVCCKVPPVVLCLTCADVMCTDCWHQVHQGRLAAHERSEMLVTAAQPSSVQQIMSHKANDAAFRNHVASYVRALRCSITSWRAQLVWLCKRTPSDPSVDLFQANPDAFFYPTRIISAFLVSVLANVTLCVLTAEYMKQARLAVYSLDSTAIRTVFKGISSLDALFYRTNVLELFDSEIDWAFQQAYTLHAEFRRIADALLYAFIIAATLSMLAYTAAWLVLLADFRVSVLAARRGQWRFDRSQIRLADASMYVGIQISNSLLTYLLVLAVAFLIALIVTYPLIIRTILSYWRVIIAVVIPALAQLIIRKVLGYKIFTNASKPFGDRIVHPRFYMLYDVIQFFLTILTGIATAIARMVVVMVFSLISLPRLDQTPLPAWVGRYLLVDNATRSYRGVIVQTAEFTNPIANVFVRLLLDSTAARGYAPRSRRLAVAKRFQLALLLLKYPQLLKYRDRSRDADVQMLPASIVEAV